MDMTPDTLPSMATAKPTLELAIILPTLNERDNLAPLVERIEGALGRSGCWYGASDRIWPASTRNE